MAVANINVMVLRDVIKFIIQSVLFDGDVPYLLLSFLIPKAMELDFLLLFDVLFSSNFSSRHCFMLVL